MWEEDRSPGASSPQPPDGAHRGPENSPVVGPNGPNTGGHINKVFCFVEHAWLGHKYENI